MHSADTHHSDTQKPCVSDTPLSGNLKADEAEGSPGRSMHMPPCTCAALSYGDHVFYQLLPLV